MDGLIAETSTSLGHVTQKTRTYIKNPARSNLDIVLLLKISGHLAAAIANGGGDKLGKVQFSELHKPRDLDLHTACHHGHTSVIDLYLYTKFH